MGIEFPSKETLENCFSYNSDGAGIMFANDGKVSAMKGFMKFNTFYSTFEKLQKKYGKETAFCFHFRIGTHGEKKSPAYCHPFPLSNKDEELKALKFTGKMGIMHNGIIYTYKRGGNSGLSDTMEFVADIAYPLLSKNPDPLKKPNLQIFQNILENSRLCTLQGSGQIQLIGDFIHDEGIYYSNDTYKKITYDYTKWAMIPERTNSKCKYKKTCYLYGVECDLCNSYDLYEKIGQNDKFDYLN